MPSWQVRIARAPRPGGLLRTETPPSPQPDAITSARRATYVPRSESRLRHSLGASCDLLSTHIGVNAPATGPTSRKVNDPLSPISPGCSEVLVCVHCACQMTPHAFCGAFETPALEGVEDRQVLPRPRLDPLE